MVVGVVFFVGGVEFLNLVFPQDLPDHLLAFDYQRNVLVLHLRLLGELSTVGDAVGDFQQFLGNLSDSKGLALFYLSMLREGYFSALLVESASSSS